jgi:rsbT co-antagonist protein RsbR
MESCSKTIEIVATCQTELLEEWVQQQLAADTLRLDLLSQQELRQQSGMFLKLFHQALRSGGVVEITAAPWTEVREFMEQLSHAWAQKGFTPSETATFVLSLKQPLFGRLRAALVNDAAALANELWGMTALLDKLGLYTTEVYSRSRQEVIARQQQEMLELSTPVVKIWEGVLALPLIGTLDSARTQIVMETLLREIVTTGYQVAIIDITGVPTVDTLVAQHLLKTTAAARLMGAECIISGIRPQIAQTMVQLGVAFGDVVTKATLADAIRHAFKSYGVAVVRNGARA